MLGGGTLKARASKEQGAMGDGGQGVKVSGQAL